ncbi:hypothetical protein [Streptomyces sp. NPDC006879]|uniref:hypothetical protein n=1 Tax=Streptomyces sp. NPDC006879 TaxID=3364767 RepID=UPI0036CB7D41
MPWSRSVERMHRPLRWALVLFGASLWWWAALRLVAAPGRAGTFECAVALGGWGISLLPVHAVPAAMAARARARVSPGSPEG